MRPHVTAFVQDDSPLAPRFLASDAESLSLFRLGDSCVLVCIWHAAPRDAALQLLHEHTRALAASETTSLSLLHIVSAEVRTLPERARSSFVQLMRSYDEKLACIGVVLEGSEVWSFVMHGIARGMRLLVGGSFALCVAYSAEGIAKSFAAAHGRRAKHEPLSPLMLLAALERARAEARARRPA